MLPELTNSAVERLHQVLTLLIDERDIRGALAIWAEEATMTLHDLSGIVVHRDQAEAWYEDILNTAETITWSLETVAVRGDLLCLTTLHSRRRNSGFGFDLLVVQEINNQGRIVRGAQFQSEDLKAAHDCLNQWWIEGLSPELAAVASAGFRINDLIEDGDRAALIETLSDDFVVIDHRSMRPHQLNRNEVINMWLTRQEATPGFILLVPTVERHTPRAMLFTATAITPDAFTTQLIAIPVLKDDIVVYLEEFDPHDLDRALARFDELTTPSH